MIELRGVPVRPWLRLQEHTDALLREFRLMPLDGAEPSGLTDTLRLLLELLPRSVVPALRQRVRAAADEGHHHADIVLPVTPEQSSLLIQLHELLCEVDEYCQKGLLLTLPLADEIIGLRGWVVREIARQVHEGAPPSVWPDAGPSDSGLPDGDLPGLPDAGLPG